MFLNSGSVSAEWSGSGPGRFTRWIKVPQDPFRRRLGGPRSRSGRRWEETDPLPLSEFEPCIFRPVAYHYNQRYGSQYWIRIWCNGTAKPRVISRMILCVIHELKGIIQGVPGGNVPDFGRMFLTLKYTDRTQNTYIRSWTVTEIMAREVWKYDSWYTLTDYQIHIKTVRNT